MEHVRPLDERGFTLLELLVVTIVIVLGSVFSLLFLLTPVDRSAAFTNGERRAEIAYIASGIRKYVAATGQLPPGIPTTPTAIGSYDDHYNLCAYLVPAYMKDMPGDPQGGVKLDSGRCDSEGVQHATGYAIVLEKNGQVTVSAPFSTLEGMPEPSITITP